MANSPATRYKKELENVKRDESSAPKALKVSSRVGGNEPERKPIVSGKKGKGSGPAPFIKFYWGRWGEKKKKKNS